VYEVAHQPLVVLHHCQSDYLSNQCLLVSMKSRTHYIRISSINDENDFVDFQHICKIFRSLNSNSIVFQDECSECLLTKENQMERQTMMRNTVLSCMASARLSAPSAPTPARERINVWSVCNCSM
jgi:hypothetical protein